jgi:hypothetical protein
MQRLEKTAKTQVYSMTTYLILNPLARKAIVPASYWAFPKIVSGLQMIPIH